MTHCNRSAATAKRRGDRGSPCLTPLLHLKSLPATPLSNTEDVADERMSFIHSIHLEGNPFALRIYMIAECSTRPKAFSKSNLRIMISLLE
jgi:hypothetical protein